MVYRNYLVIVFSMLLGGMALCCIVLATIAQQKQKELPSPEGRNWRLSYYEAGHPVSMDHDIFYYGFGPSMKRAKEADVLILGHSMTLFAFEAGCTAEFARKHHVSFFHLGLLSETGSEFFMKLMDRFRFHPVLVLVMPEYSGRLAFFEDGLTTFASSIISEGAVRRYFSNLLNQHVRWWASGEKPSHLLYRSEENGLLEAAIWPGYDSQNEEFTADTVNCPQPASETLSRARLLKDRIEKMGGRLVFFVVPGRNNCLEGSREIARRLGVTFLETDGKQITSFDGGYHLDRAGSLLFTQRFLAALEASDEFERIRNISGFKGKSESDKR